MVGFLVQALDQLARAEREVQRVAAGAARVELLPVGKPADVVNHDVLAGFGGGAAAEHEVFLQKGVAEIVEVHGRTPLVVEDCMRPGRQRNLPDRGKTSMKGCERRRTLSRGRLLLAAGAAKQQGVHSTRKRMQWLASSRLIRPCESNP